eukprot:COSAG05_NODE_4954_length_1312_cov_1.612531_1_plen_420_part_01
MPQASLQETNEDAERALADLRRTLNKARSAILADPSVATAAQRDQLAANLRQMSGLTHANKDKQGLGVDGEATQEEIEAYLPRIDSMDDCMFPYHSPQPPPGASPFQKERPSAHTFTIQEDTEPRPPPPLPGNSRAARMRRDRAGDLAEQAERGLQSAPPPPSIASPFTSERPHRFKPLPAAQQMRVVSLEGSPRTASPESPEKAGPALVNGEVVDVVGREGRFVQLASGGWAEAETESGIRKLAEVKEHSTRLAPPGEAVASPAIKQEVDVATTGAATAVAEEETDKGGGCVGVGEDFSDRHIRIGEGYQVAIPPMESAGMAATAEQDLARAGVAVECAPAEVPTETQAGEGMGRRKDTPATGVVLQPPPPQPALQQAPSPTSPGPPSPVISREQVRCCLSPTTDLDNDDDDDDDDDDA